MNCKYYYLKQYINNEKEWPANHFLEVKKEDIIAAEQRLGMRFPDSIREFWLEIGYGFLVVTDPKIGVSSFDFVNRVMAPKQIADIMLLKEESGLILPEAVEYIDDGYVGKTDIIFFEIGDMSNFLVMKPQSSKPDAVYDLLGEVIEESFERFIWRLYYESPTYYLDVK